MSDVENHEKATPKQLAYCAGLIDSDGSVAIKKFKDPASPHGHRYIPDIKLTSIDHVVLHYLQSVLGGIVNLKHQGPTTNPNVIGNHPAGRWQIQGRQAYVVAQLLMPHMLVKRGQMECVLDFYGEGSRFKIGTTPSTSEMSRRIDIWTRARLLNAREARPDIPAPRMEETALAYCAGLLDGDGSFTIRRTKNKVSSGGVMHSPRIAVRCSDYEMLDFLVATLKGSVTNPINNDFGTVRQTSLTWQWAVQSRQAAVVAKAVLPYLIIKLEQARCLVDFYEAATFKPDGRALPAHEIERRDVLWRKVSERNQRR